MTDLQVLYQKKGEIIHEMRDIYAQADKEDRGLNTDEETKWGKLEEDLQATIKRIEKGEEVRALLDDQEKYLAELPKAEEEIRSQLTTATVIPSVEPEKKTTYGEAFKRWAVHGPGSLTPEMRKVLAPYEKRGTSTQVSDNAGLGGYLSPEEWANQVVESMKVFGGMLQAGQIIRTRGGDTFHIPTEDTTAQLGAIIGQGVADIVADVTWGEKTMTSFTYTSQVIKIAQELWAEDDTFDVLSRVQGIASRRVGRKLNLDLTTGAGTTEPFGVVTESTNALTAASNAAITRTELLDLIHAVDPAYRVGPSVGFMFNDSTLAAIRKLSIGSSDDRPLWVPSMREGEPSTIEGHRYFINQDVASIGTTAISVLFGDFSKYWIRQIRGMTLSRSDQRYWEERVVAYFLTARFDGKLTDVAAVKHLDHPV